MVVALEADPVVETAEVAGEAQAVFPAVVVLERVALEAGQEVEQEEVRPEEALEPAQGLEEAGAERRAVLEVVLDLLALPGQVGLVQEEQEDLEVAFPL